MPVPLVESAIAVAISSVRGRLVMATASSAKPIKRETPTTGRGLSGPAVACVS
jgi:hypothetical protein